jgi:hypothetical protein
MSALLTPVLLLFQRLEPDYTALAQLADVTLVTAFKPLLKGGFSYKP